MPGGRNLQPFYQPNSLFNQSKFKYKMLFLYDTSQYDSDSLALLLFHDKNNFPVLSTCQPSCFVCDTSHFGESYVRMISCGIDMWPVVTKSRELFLFVCNCLFVFRLLFFWIESFENIIIIKSAPTSKNAVSAFQITCTLLSVTLNDSWKK